MTLLWMKTSMFSEVTWDPYSAVHAIGVIPWYSQELSPCTSEVKVSSVLSTQSCTTVHRRAVNCTDPVWFF